jgi:hypothetical protein
MFVQRLSRAGCLASAHSWREHAEILRTHAQVSYLNEDRRQILEREADAADRQADMWLDAAAEE